MTKPEFFVTPGYGDRQLAHLHYSQAVRIGDRVEISGQGGWDDDFNSPDTLHGEIERAFDNVERTLVVAGATWRDVVHVNTYHVLDTADFAEHNRLVVKQFRTRMGDRSPIWTESGVTALGNPNMHIEVRVAAVISNQG